MSSKTVSKGAFQGAQAASQSSAPVRKRKPSNEASEAKVQVPAVAAAAAKKQKFPTKPAEQVKQSKEEIKRPQVVDTDDEHESEESADEEVEEENKEEDGDEDEEALAQAHASATFQSLGIVDALVESCLALGWKKPSDIQREALPWALQGTFFPLLVFVYLTQRFQPGRDVIALAETGSGKTGAFALPILQALLENPQPLFALVMAPTRYAQHDSFGVFLF